MLLSSAMISCETPVVYAARYGDIPHFTVCSSESQGFDWNQDIFASQYQQMCKVVYDGHEDCVDELLSQDWNCELHDSPDVFDDENQDVSSQDELRVRRVSQVLMRPRRRSERSLSFVSDSKNGHYQRAETVVIDVEENTEENRRLKRLIMSDRDR
ncbi:LANO_0E01068g1_1 [Lachancea nothofagi CBS 11611]|uniref:LANO_0E01068g1_1 n=1 Tax=Lachancea nothofagi CBS 11611 TaxID=1266666 RepID=A0A1G4JP24_9SACH|nr:LANO_0E01068g1_1 [Lachancea nothofagi CBS 11611]